MMSAGPIDVEWWEEALAHLNRFADSLQNDARALATIVGDEVIARTERLSRKCPPRSEPDVVVYGT
jgi:hypothetical protein